MVGLFADPERAASPRPRRDLLLGRGADAAPRRSRAALFDEAFPPAYCEDADLCLRLLAAGRRVRYVHAAHGRAPSQRLHQPPVADAQIAQHRAQPAEAGGALGRPADAAGCGAADRLLSAAVPSDAGERSVVGQRLHRMDQRGEGAAELCRPLPAASALRSRLLRPAHRGRADAARRGWRGATASRGSAVYYYEVESLSALIKLIASISLNPALSTIGLIFGKLVSIQSSRERTSLTGPAFLK